MKWIWMLPAEQDRTFVVHRPTATDTPSTDGLGFTHILKVQHFNKKTLPSKEDSGVFHNRKQETIVAMAEKEVQHDPPVELFSKRFWVATEVCSFLWKSSCTFNSCIASLSISLGLENNWYHVVQQH